MKTTLPRILAIAAAFLIAPLLGQNNDGTNNPNAPGNPAAGGAQDSANSDLRFWEARMPNGNYLVALDRINSIARHEYVISNAASRVVELTLSTSSGSVVRFYFVEPLAASAPGIDGAARRGQELVDRAGERAGQNLNNVVTKEYPLTTHTGQVEYRLSTERAIQQLHRSVTRAWKDRRGRVVTVQ